MPLFAGEFAREAGRKSAALAAQRKANPPPPVELPLVNGERTSSPEALRVLERLNALDLLMSKAKTDREWDNLSRAYERMFKVWAYLTQTPGPGSLRPQSPKQLSTQATFDSPLLPADQPPKPQVYDGPENG
jgi:hypothetical protein